VSIPRLSLALLALAALAITPLTPVLTSNPF
jgi:hypothetical protein